MPGKSEKPFEDKPISKETRNEVHNFLRSLHNEGLISSMDRQGFRTIMPKLLDHLTSVDERWILIKDGNKKYNKRSRYRSLSRHVWVIMDSMNKKHSPISKSGKSSSVKKALFDSLRADG